MEYLSRVHTYADKCMLDIFLELCREDYVGGDDTGFKSKLVHNICNQLSLIKMSNMDTPDKIYDKHIIMVVGLLEDASL